MKPAYIDCESHKPYYRYSSKEKYLMLETDLPLFTEQYKSVGQDANRYSGSVQGKNTVTLTHMGCYERTPSGETLTHNSCHERPYKLCFANFKQ